MGALLIHQGALGDWVLVWPLLRALAERDGWVVAAAASSKARLAARFIPGVEPVDADAQAWSRLHAPAADLPPILPRKPADLDLIVSFVSTGSDAWAGNAERFWPGARRVFVSPRPPRDWPGHVCDFHRQELARQGVTLPIPAPLPQVRRDGPILLHPGSGGRDKCWPVERFEALAAALRAAGREVAGVLGPVEIERWPADLLNRWRRDLDARQCLSLDELAQAMMAARGWVGNDSGSTHLAAALGLPTVAIFGPSSPAQWAPRGCAVAVVAPPSPGPITWLDPVAAAKAVLGRIA